MCARMIQQDRKVPGSISIDATPLQICAAAARGVIAAGELGRATASLAARAWSRDLGTENSRQGGIGLTSRCPESARLRRKRSGVCIEIHWQVYSTLPFTAGAAEVQRFTLLSCWHGDGKFTGRTVGRPSSLS